MTPVSPPRGSPGPRSALWLLPPPGTARTPQGFLFPPLFFFLPLFFFSLPFFFHLLFFSLFYFFLTFSPSPPPQIPFFPFLFLPLHCKKSSLTKALSPQQVTASDLGMQRTPISLPYPIHTQPVSSPRVCGEEDSEESISKVSAVACQSSWQGCGYALKGTQDL